MLQLGLRQQVVELAILPFLLIVGAIGISMLRSYHLEAHKLDEQQALRAARLLANNASWNLPANGDTQKLQSLVDSAIDQDVLGAGIRDAQHRPLASSGQLDAAPDTTVDPSRRIRWEGDSVTAQWPIYRYNRTSMPLPDTMEPPLLGWALITAQPRSLMQLRHRTITWGVLWTLMALLTIVYLGGRLSRNLLQRLQQLRHILRHLDQQEWSTRLPDSKYQDWQLIATAINELAHRTQQTFRRLQNEVEHSHQDLQRTLEHLEISNMELELAREEALSASQSKSEFLANTSHEVRTPLTGILGFCKVLLKTEDNPRRREYLESIRNSADHLLGILNDILDLSKIEAGKFSLNLKRFDPLQVIEESSQLFAQQAADKGIALIVHADASLPRQLLGDAARIKQLATNLISNAVKFTDEGQVHILLSGDSLDQEQVELRLEISDTGIGIEETQRTQLFEAFQQLDGSEKRQHGGTGLGLAIVKQLSKLMNGGVSLMPKTGAGSCFVLTLPLTRLEDETDQTVKQPTAPVLLWEDNPDAGRAIAQRLIANQIVFTACDSIESVCALAGENCTVLLGFRNYEQFTNREKWLPKTSHIVILLPSLAQVMSRQDYLFLQKPVAERQLLTALSRPLPEESRFPARAVFAPQAAKLPEPTPVGDVLAVDDNAANRLLISALLEELKVPATICATGREALRHCQEQHFPLIIVDLQMPDLSGAETASAIRRTKANRNSYIVALTAHLPDDDHSQFDLEAFDELLEKPLTLDRLIMLRQSTRTEKYAKPVSLALGLERANGNHQLAGLLLERFLSGLSATRENWKKALEERDIHSLRSAVHQLTGACRYVGLPHLEAGLENLHRQLRDEPGDKVWREASAIIDAMSELLTWHQQVDVPLLFELEAGEAEE